VARDIVERQEILLYTYFITTVLNVVTLLTPKAKSYHG